MNNLKNNRYCVIMAGGIGARFWPMSKTATPKQFIDILGIGKTLLQMTFDRFNKICPNENIYIVTNEIYRELILEQLPMIGSSQVLCEPMRRNTAPCIAYANHVIKQKNPKAVVVVAPSDHIILKENVFTRDIEQAMDIAETHEWLITLGIKPNRPDTGYGYIQYLPDEILDEIEQLKKVKQFTEKPNLERAEKFIQSGDFLWNAGIFIWSLESINAAFKKYLSEVNDLFDNGAGKYGSSNEKSFIEKTYLVCPNISIDYGIMEKADNVYVMAVDFGWSDLGTWGSLFEIRQKDTNNNAIVGNNVMTYNTKNCIINMPNEKLVVVQGLEDYIIVEDSGTLLICKKGDEQQIRQFVDDVKTQKSDKYI